MDLTIDRQIKYNDVEYQVLEVLRSGMVLVVFKKDFDEGNFPLKPLIIPEKDFKI